MTSSLGSAIPLSTDVSDVYQPTEEQRERISDVKKKYDDWKRFRQPHERQWFVNASFARAQQYVDVSMRDHRMGLPPDLPSHRVRIVANKILPKLRARRSKFLKNRPTWIVVPASPDQDDKMNARATQKGLDYLWRKLQLDLAHLEAILWAEVCGRGYWWIYWDPKSRGRVGVPDPVTGKVTVQSAELGDCAVEVGTPFEVLVGDPNKVRISDMPEIIRVKLRRVDEMKARYPNFASYIKGGSEEGEDPFQYETKIGTLNASGYGMRGLETKEEQKKDKCLVIEYFQRPSADLPDGRYTVICGDILLKDEMSLPYGFGDMQNPYPVVEFIDMPIAGQYYGTTLIEQLIGIQREYNLLKSKLSEQMRLNAHPKLLVAAQHQLKVGSYTSEPGEVLTYVARPGIPPPQQMQPQMISGDVWRSLELLTREFEDISQIFPSSEGKAGQAQSGFQTNLLQEAADAVHMPDILLHEQAIKGAAFKFRRLMKMGYTVPRMITAIGRDYEPDVIEFSEEQIDENADIIVEAGSGLPQTRFARIDAVRGLFKDGLLGNPMDPDTIRRAMTMMELGTTEDAYDFTRRDIDRARIENTQFEEGKEPQRPMFYDNHQVHYQIHTDILKAVDPALQDPILRLAIIGHIL